MIQIYISTSIGCEEGIEPTLHHYGEGIINKVRRNTNAIICQISDALLTLSLVYDSV